MLREKDTRLNENSAREEEALICSNAGARFPAENDVDDETRRENVDLPSRKRRRNHSTWARAAQRLYFYFDGCQRMDGTLPAGAKGRYFGFFPSPKERSRLADWGTFAFLSVALS